MKKANEFANFQFKNCSSK